MLPIVPLVHGDVLGVLMACAAPRLNVLNHRIAQVEADNNVAIRDVEPFLCNGAGEEAVVFALFEPVNGKHRIAIAHCQRP